MAKGKFFTVEADVSHLVRSLDLIEKDIPFLTAFSLTKTAQDIKAAELEVMGQVFDRPTKFTMNALYVKPATKTDLTAVVEFKEKAAKSIPAWRYLGPHVEGGGRDKKSHERGLERVGILRSDEWAIPGRNVPVDAFGNVPGKVFLRILSQLQAAEQFAGSSSNMTARSRKRALKAAGGRYFVMRNSKTAPDGIYLRENAGTKITAVLLFVKQPQYKKRFPFYETAQRVYEQNVAPNFRAGWEKYVEPRLKASTG